ncbi:MAG TPA: dehypoxanthine futalosine cyclase, partial [Acidobacteria bacterium]|nr:dehypoxanthine futalosine cyclase [Acidobacteriota bacterium]
MSVEAVAAKVRSGGRIDRAEALTLYADASTLLLGQLADAIRARKHPSGAVTYIIDRNVNPTNVCITDCGFCAFYRSPGDADAYILPREVIYQKVDELIAQGGMQLLLQGGHHPGLKTEWYAELFQDLKARYPQVWIHGMSPPEITHVAKMEKRPVQDV